MILVKGLILNSHVMDNMLDETFVSSDGEKVKQCQK